ncbi:HepT-like ribonuclease domain-containing protein [Mucilaginibacter ginkgonis]|uniref:DUF86 domain-containing protein n=1 Tax=Mucilaginibacter ginkgonis TaxID=2682091 RepID=A0A7T7F8H7_9SPHI|nr:DUF86 domain-containing protein [Mucilaginibacter ginkgonis]QQL48737.1 DUF86 domain-containing protein [Mucilaginibacter ginkgonis]
MKPHERDPLLYLEDIKLSIERITQYLDSMDFIAFQDNYMVIDAVIRNFEVIGEASKRLSSEIKLKYPNVPWEEMYRLRNKISHEYFGIDHEIIWSIAKEQLPQNYQDILEVIEREARI